MKRIGLLLLLLAFILSLSPGFAQSGNAIVRFGDLHGEVNVRPNDEDDDAYIFAELKTPLKHNDRIRTLPRSGAILSFSDMSTFVMKEDTTIVLDIANERQSKIGLVAGNVWVNLKKMVADGSMEVEMSQAVAGIKGTNITCSSNSSEDRVQVLRGMASVLIKESRETVEVNEGEELVIKKGGKSEKVKIDIKAVEKVWEKEISKLGESIELNEVPDILKGILDSSSAEFGKINEVFTKLIAMEKVEAAEASSLKKDAERFVGVLLEDALILASIRRKIEAAMVTPDLTAADKVRLSGLMKNVADISAKEQQFLAEINKIMRYQFKLSALSEEFQAELEVLRTELAQSTSEIDSIRAVLSANPAGQSQEWFVEAAQVCSQALTDLAELSQRVANILAEDPTNVEAQAVLKSIASQQAAIATMLKSLTVVEVDASTITEMQQIDDVLSDQLVALQTEISSYNSISDSLSAGASRASINAGEQRLIASVKIMSSFARVRRLYVNAQRLYDSTMRASAGSAYRTSEQEDMESMWMNVSDRFQQLGVVAEELQSNIQDLENQLNELIDGR
ncbi:MAG: FecR domain-containing protein [Candidatus Riflebacteria bacterium]|nr:FecR domain-containing protein [Candidatus Riflebacteria bacterium]